MIYAVWSRLDYYEAEILYLAKTLEEAEAWRAEFIERPGAAYVRDRADEFFTVEEHPWGEQP